MPITTGWAAALCPAAIGFTHHIGPWGDIEPCPIIQLAKDSIHDGRLLAEVFSRRRSCGISARRRPLHPRLHPVRTARPAPRTRRAARRPATRRPGAPCWQELAAMEARRRNSIPDAEIPEKSWAYRLAKRLWFNDYGVYRPFALPPEQCAAPCCPRRKIRDLRLRLCITVGAARVSGTGGPPVDTFRNTRVQPETRPRRACSVERMILHYRRIASEPAPAELARWSE